MINNLKQNDGNDNEIMVENLAAVKSAAIPAVPGHLTILRGANGSGKTHTLNAIRALSTGHNKKDLPLRDGEKKGRIEFGGVRITLGKVNRGLGEADIASIEGDFAIEDLVSPGLKKDEAADAKSIKALIRLLAPDASFSLFADLLPPEDVDAIISAAARECDDLVKMASGIKRDIEKAARQVETEVENHERNIAAVEKSIEHLDLTKECDQKKLQDALEAAISHLSQLQTKKQNADEAAEARAKARREMEEYLSESDPPGMTLEEAEADVAQKNAKVEAIDSEIEQLESQIRELKKDKKTAEGDLEDAEGHRDAVKAYEDSIAAWKKSIDENAAVAGPTDDEITDAEIARDMARSASDEGVRIRDAQKQQRQIEADREKVRQLSDRAIQLRDAAKATDEVLSNVIAASGSPLQVKTIDGETRLVLKTERADATYYRELSEGERWKIALDIAIEALSKVPAQHRMLVIGQTAWEALDASNRRLIRERIAGTEISVFTAEASREGDPGELTPVVA